MDRIQDFDYVIVIDGKTNGLAKIEPLASSFKFYTTAMYNDGKDVRARTFKLTKQDAKTFLENYGNTTLYVGVNFGGGPGVLLNGFTIENQEKIRAEICDALFDKLVNSIFHEGDKVILPYSYVEKNRYIITSYAEAEFRKAENGKVYGYYTENNRTQYVELATSKEFLKCWTKAK